jgi:hypothetical protein
MEKNAASGLKTVSFALYCLLSGAFRVFGLFRVSGKLVVPEASVPVVACVLLKFVYCSEFVCVFLMER